MEEWKEYKLGEICTKIGSGATPKGGKEAYLGGDTSLIRSQNVLDFSFSWDGLAYIDDEQATKLNGVEIAKGDVLLNITGDSVARACIVPESALPARVNQHVSIIRGDTSLVLNDYIMYFLQYKKPYLLSLSQGGATRNALTKGMIEDLAIPLPPLSKQKEIVRILKKLDDKIEVNRRINDNLTQQAQALFKSWFVDFEPFKGGIFIESDFGMIPKGWRLGKLDDIIEERAKSTIQVKQAREVKGDYPFFTSGTAILEYPNYLVKGRNLFLNTGGVAGVKYYIGNAAYSTDTWCIGGIDSYTDYLYLYLKSIEDILNIQYFEGSALKHLKKRVLKERNLVVPPLSVVSEFNKLAVPFFDKINSLYRQNRTLSIIRDTLLPRLMSGELKVKDIEDSL